MAIIRVSMDKLKSLIADTYNRGGRSTLKPTISIGRSLGIVTLNLDRLGKLFSNYKLVKV